MSEGRPPPVWHWFNYLHSVNEYQILLLNLYRVHSPTVIWTLHPSSDLGSTKLQMSLQEGAHTEKYRARPLSSRTLEEVQVAKQDSPNPSTQSPVIWK